MIGGESGIRLHGMSAEDQAESGEVDVRRRDLIRAGGIWLMLAQVGLTRLGNASSAIAAPFSATTLGEALNALGGIPVSDLSVDLTLPETVEDGAVVPISVSSELSGVDAIYILVDTNPYPFAVAFSIPEGTEPFVSIRLKLAQSGAVHAVVRANGRLYSRVKETRVTVGGCA
jgi:sulfur-oxidizing protein SoxY